MKFSGFFVSFLLLSIQLYAQLLPGFKPSGQFDEQQRVIENVVPGTRILINAPLKGFEPGKQVLLVFYALPNGNTIEQTAGKTLKAGDDWHFDIQHIGAQTRFLRNVLTSQTVVVAYLENSYKSWPAWKAATPGYREQVRQIVDVVKDLFAAWNPRIVLNGHSGGGRFILSYLDAFEDIPPDVERIAFLDSNYGYEDFPYGEKIVRWLKSPGKQYLSVLAYNDSVVIYSGKPLVSPTGGTWYRTGMMLDYFGRSFRFRQLKHDSLQWFVNRNRTIEIIRKPNPGGRIYHTVQVERNGYIHGMLSGTRHEQKGYTYFGERAYNQWIADSVIIPIRSLNIPAGKKDAEPGSAFMARMAGLPLNEREEEIYKAIASGNVPNFLRNTVTLEGKFEDATGVTHEVQYEAMPDYLAVGHDADFCRVPMNPHTAQRLADLSGGSLLTAKLSDHIYGNATVQLTPFNYIPVGNANELVSKFTEHNRQIEKQFAEAGGIRGQLIAGIKKDVILSEQIARQPNKVVIYGWHKPDGKPIQPVYSGHVDWYVDYSHGIRLINDQVLIDGQKASFREILRHPVLFRIFSDEPVHMEKPEYYVPDNQ